MVANVIKVWASRIEYYESKNEAEPLEYYLKETVARNIFAGRGAATLGIDGRHITPKDAVLKALFKGQHPHTGEALIRGTNTARTYQTQQGKAVHKSVVALDITLSPPKSVTLGEALSRANGDYQTAYKFWQCHERAALRALDWVEQNLLWTRLEAGGTRPERVHGVFALIHHSTSRQVSLSKYPDPQLHTHALLFNAGFRSNGKTGAIDANPLFRSQHRIGEIYHRSLQQELKREFGFSFRHVELKKGWSFEIEGIPYPLLRAFSKRRVQIEGKLKGHETSKQVRTVVLATRQPKATNFDHRALYEHWRHTAQAYGFDMTSFIQEVAQQRDLTGQKPEQSSNPVRSQVSPGSKSQLTRGEKPLRPQEYQSSSVQVKHSLSVTERLFNLPVSDIRLSESSPVSPKVTTQYSQSRSQQIPKSQPSVQSPKISVQRQQRLNRKFLWLYATGRISRKTYLQVTQGKGLPQRRWGIDFAYATYRISQAQRIYLYGKYGYGLPKGIPTHPIGINLAYATRKITAGQRLYLLNQQQKPQDRLGIKHRRLLGQTLKRFLKPTASTQQQLSTERRARPSLLQQLHSIHERVQSQRPQSRHRLHR